MGINPALVWAGRKCDDYTRFFSLNYAEILGFQSSHNPDHDDKGETRTRCPDTLEQMAAPKIFSKFN
jgi:hypothetical protein